MMDKLLQGKYVEDAALLKHVPLLQKSLSGEWGYIYEELIDLSYSGGPESNRFMSFFYSKALGITDNKLRILKIIHKLSQDGSRYFRALWRESHYDEILRELSGSGGEIQTLSKEIRGHIFSDEVMARDADQSISEVPPRMRHSLSGHGSNSTHDKKYEGFGKDAYLKEETWTDKLRGLVEESLLDSRRAKVLDEYLSPESPGDYVPIVIPQTSSATTGYPSVVETHISSPLRRTHVPGKAGGGWESEDDEPDLEEISKIALNMTASDLVVEMREDMLIDEDKELPCESLESKEVNAFCDQEEPILSFQEPLEVAARLKRLNILTALAVLKSKLGSSKKDSILLRSLILIEVLIGRQEKIKPRIYKEAFEEPLSTLMEQQTNTPLQLKAKKLHYSIQRLLSESS